MASVKNFMKTKNTYPAKPEKFILRSALLMALWLGFWLLPALFMLALLALPFSQLQAKAALELSGFAAISGALLLAYTLRPRGWSNAAITDPHSLILMPAQAPLLHTLLQHMAGEMKLLAPIEVRLISSTEVRVHAKRNWRGKLSGLQIGLGLPLFGSLSETELSALIVHEFAHLLPKQAALCAWIYRIRQKLVNAVSDLDHSLFLPDKIIYYFALLFLRLSAPLARAHEFAADALAARQTGVIATRAALEKIHLIGPMWFSYLDYELLPAVQRGACLPIFEGFRSFCQPTTKRAAVQEAIRRAANRPTAQFDCHPTLAERIDALTPGGKPAYPPLAQCLHLLGGPSAAEQTWYSQFGQGRLRETSWDAFGEQILQAQILKRFAGNWMDPAKMPLTQLPQLAYQFDDLWDKLRPEGISFLSTQGQRNYVLELLEEWISACLITRGFSPKVAPGQALAMQRDAQLVQPADLLSAAIGGTLKSAHLKQFDLPAG